MNNFLSQIRAANQQILNNGICWDAVLTIKSGAEYEIQVFSPDIGLDINPDTGLALVGRRISASFRIDDIALSDIPNAKIKFTSFDEEIEGVLKNPMYDRSLGFVTASVRLIQVL